MDKRAHYQEIIKTCLGNWEAYIQRGHHNGIEIQRIFDEVHDQFLLVYLGWDQRRRVQQTALHLRLKNDKIWVEIDETEEGIATALLRAGVPREDIVLAFHPPELRHLSEFSAV